MRATRSTIPATFLILAAMACDTRPDKGDAPATGHDGAPPAPAGVETVAAELPEGVHPVLCGCVVPGVGRCGNHVVVDGETLPLGGDIGLGKMEFCGRSGLTAELEGGVQDGVFVATSYSLRE